MSLLETQNFLARIYTDENLRREFLSAPEEIGKQNALSKPEIVEILEIFHEEINAFAESLVWKRLREVEKLLPLSREKLNTEFVYYFRRFAPTFNSRSVRKHLDDAVCFAKYLQNCETVSDIVKNAAKYECAKLEFYALNKHIVIKYFNFDVQSGARKKHLKIWLRIGKREFVF
jgi:hypothetical protein